MSDDGANPIVPLSERPREDIVAELEAYYRAKGLAGQAATLAENHADKPLARLQGNAAPILARLMAGESPKQVAQSYGVSREALNAWLLRNAAEEWRAVSAGKALAKLEDAEADIEASESMVDVSRAREKGKLATWHLERMIPHLYAAKGEASGVSITVNVNRQTEEPGITIEQGQD